MDELDSSGSFSQAHPTSDSILHHSLYIFAQETPCLMLQTLLISPPPSEAQPGGGHLCLRIVAFWLSWLRSLYCSAKPQGFRVGKVYLDKIEALIIEGSDAQVGGNCDYLWLSS